jgi:amidophosphoribosyltransferase
VKDAKMRTFISGDDIRDEMVSSVYDVTPGILEPGVDSLVCVDDSIVRGTTLRKSIMHNLARLKPRKIVIASSAPQIRYPDCYGIDMAKIGSLVAFEAAIALLRERGMGSVIDEVYHAILELRAAGRMESENVVKRIYAPFHEDEITAKITELVTPEDFPHEFEVVYQSIEDLHIAIPNHSGDWYFSGNYPTPGGNRVVNQAFVNYYEGKNVRAYQVG